MKSNRIYILIVSAISTLLLTYCKPDKRRNFFNQMPEKYRYLGKEDNNIKNRFILKNGLSEKATKIDDQYYYSLFENESDKLNGLSGYIRKDGSIVYIIPYNCKIEQKLIDFNSKVNDTTFLSVDCQSNKIGIVLKAIRNDKGDDLYTYQIFHKGNGCEDCTRLVFFTVGLKSGFTWLHFKNISNNYDVNLTSSEILFKKVPFGKW